MNVLITDANTRTALAAARSLVAAGFRVHAGTASRWSLAGAARGVVPLRLPTDALTDPVTFVGALRRAVTDLDIGVLLPVTDESVQATLEWRGLLPRNVILPLPSLPSFRAASDKLRALELARACGMDVPETITLHSPRDPCPEPGFFPGVLKPHRSVVGAGAQRRKASPLTVADPARCRAALVALPQSCFPVLLQRYVPGHGEGLFLLRWSGRLVASFAHRRLREKPPEGGVSVYRESIAADPRLVDAGTRLLERLEWQGVAMIEYRHDVATGRRVLMEINGRFWGSLQLAIDAGVDFPRLLLACVRGQPVTSVLHYQTGVRSRWLWGDLDHLYLRLARGRPASNGNGSRLASLTGFFAHRPGRDRLEVERATDPGPAIVETLRRLHLLAQ